MQWQPLVLPSYRGDIRAVGRGRAGLYTKLQGVRLKRNNHEHDKPVLKRGASTGVNQWVCPS
jgi:hypothetical protein